MVAILCNTAVTWGAWDNDLIPDTWQVCNLSQWSSYAPHVTPNSLGLGSLWIDNNTCANARHHQIYEWFEMDRASCYDGSDCCWTDIHVARFAICSP